MKKKFHKKSNKHAEKNFTHEKLDGTERQGLVVAHFGATADVEDEANSVFHCHLRRNSEPCITGDRVLFRRENDGSGVVVSILPRQSLFVRLEKGNKNKLIAANIDAMIIVVAPPPLFAERLIDRYLVAAESLRIKPVILLNKIDLLNKDELLDLEERLLVYKKMGYSVLFSSIYQNGLNDLSEFLLDKTCVLVGVSGVGKSSIIAAYTGLNNIMIGDVSTLARLGKHTTTTTRLYHLPQGGNLIDSPGVREFALWHLPAAEILHGFIDFHPFLSQCKFRNCHHQSEPGCALLQALEDKLISEERFASYQEILQDLGS